MLDTHCAQCGADNPPDTAFCRNCGVRFPGAAAQTPSASVARRGKTVGLIVLGVAVLGGAIVAWQLLRPGAGGALERVTMEKNTAQAQLGATRALTAEKDSLLSELLETTSLITDISQAVTAVQNGRNAPILEESGRPMTTRQARAFLLPKIDSLRLRLQAAEGRLGASVDRVRQIPTSDELRNQIAQYERTVASVRKLVATQQEQLATLGTEVTSLRAENSKLLETQGQLVAAQRALQDSMVGLKEDENTVYWIAGSKSRLLELRVVVEEGGGKVLVFGKGKTLAPARTLTASDFTPVNKRETVTILLPKATSRYRILTRQNLSALENALDKEGHVRVSLRIRDPAAFWASSPYLVLLEDN